MRIKPSFAIAGGLVLALAGWLASGYLGGEAALPEAAQAPTPAERVAVRVRPSTAETIERAIVLNGHTEPAREVTLRAETGGRVVELGQPKGALVEQGDLIVHLDPRAREAIVSMAEAKLRQREIEFEAASQLGKKGFQAETQVAEAEAALELARADLKAARIELDHTVVRAPFDGVLDTRPVEIGDFVDVGDPVATVIEQDPYLVVAEVPERSVGNLEAGMPGRARLITGQEVEGKIRYLESAANPATRTFTVELEVPNPGRRFAAGVSAELRIVWDRVPGHRIASSLLGLNDEGVLGVKSVDDEGLVRFHQVEVVQADDDSIWVAGLPDEVTLITVGQAFVRAGDQVRPVPETGRETTPGAPELVAETGP